MRRGIAAAAVVHHAAAVHHHEFVGRQRHGQFVQHADHGAARGDQRAHGLHPVGLVRWVEVGERLVHQQQLGLDRERARQQHALALAARELAQRPLAPVPGLGGAQRAFHGGAVGRVGRGQPALVRQAAEHRDVVDQQVVGRALARHALAQPRESPRALACRQLRGGLAEQAQLAAVREQARQHLEQGRLAGAVGADDAGPARGADREVDAVQHLGAAERRAHAAHLERLGGGGRHEAVPLAVRRCISHSR